MTLVELLAALSILSVVILLAGSIHMFGQRQFKTQRDSAYRSNDLSYALSVMSTDIRKRSMNHVQISDEIDGIFIREPEEEFASTPTYYVGNNQLMKDGQVLTDSVSKMEVEELGTYGFLITLHSSGENISNKKYQTKVVGRGGYDETKPTPDSETESEE